MSFRSLGYAGCQGLRFVLGKGAAASLVLAGLAASVRSIKGGVMSRPIGRFVWVIPEGYIPSESHGPQPAMTSHEAACLLNAGDTPAHVRITIFYADREPIRPYEVVVPPRRTLHLRFNDLDDPAPIPRDTDYSSVNRVRRSI